MLKAIFEMFLINSDYPERSQENKKRMKALIESESLSCKKCDGLSLPLWGTTDKYKCVKCGRQFANTKHYLTSKSQNRLIGRTNGTITLKISTTGAKKYYDECVAEITQENQ